MNLDIVIPVFNEGESILPVLASIENNVKRSCRILICFDHQDDSTMLALRKYTGRLTILPVKNTGKGVHGAVMTGFRASSAACVIMIPADDDYNAKIIDSMVEAFDRGSDIVCASRFMPGGNMVGCPFLKNILVRTGNFLLFHLAGLPTRDASNGFRLFSRRAINEITIESSQGFTYSIEYVVKAHRLGWKVSEVPAHWYERKTGESRFRLLKWLPEYLRWFLYAFQTRWLV